jgi:hypothetical protein
MTFKSSLFPAGKTSLQEKYLKKEDAEDSFDKHLHVGRYINWGTASFNGVNTPIDRSSPVQFGLGTDWKYITFSAGIKNNGSLWLWSSGSRNGDGNAFSSSRSSPVQLGTDTNWKSINLNGAVFGIKTDGSLWSWGVNNFGVLGLNLSIISTANSPTRIGTGKWKQAQDGGQSAIGLTVDGKVFCWGYNFYGQLGDNTNIDRSSPVQVGSESYWKLVACGSEVNNALKNDGTIWGWGNGLTGHIGVDGSGNIPTPAWRSSPLQVVGSENKQWRFISAAGRGGLLAGITTDNQLWLIGKNQQGQFGNNTQDPTGSVISIVQIGTSKDWKTASVSFGGVRAIKDDGSLWVWGFNSYGELGLGDVASRSSPVLFNANTNWKSVHALNYITFGLTYERPV